MSYIRNRKHAARQPILRQSLITLAVLGAPLGAHAQEAARQESTLPEVSVSAAADVPFKADKVSSPKLTQPLVDTTQTITVIKKEVLQEQGASSLMEALRNTPGITLQMGENGNTSAGDTFQMRGFSTQSSIFLDGVRDLGPVARDVFNIEQIEVSRGPAGADVGRGAASGYINLVSKLPQQDNATSASLGYDSGSKKRATADLNRTFGASGAFRLNVMAEDGGLMGREVIEKKATGIAPSLAFGLGTPTRVYLYSQHMRQDGTPDGGLPAIGIDSFYNANSLVAGAPRVDRDLFYGYDSDYENVDSDMATVKVEHQLGANAMLTNTTRYGKSNMDRILTGINAMTIPGPDRSTWTVARTRQSVLQENRIMANTTNVVSEFSTGAVSHTLSAGLEFLSEKQDSVTRNGLGTLVPANLYNPVGGAAPAAYNPAPSGAYANGTTKTAAIYAFDTLKLNEQWQLNAGLRLERYDTETDSVTASRASDTSVPVGTLQRHQAEKSGTLASWKAGALYKPAPNGSVYASVASSQTPPGTATFSFHASPGNINNASMDPQKTTNVELGTKWDLIEKKLAVTGTLYRTENENEFPVLEDPVAQTYAQVGNRRVQGLELGVVGQITPAWNIIAGVATMDAELTEGTGTGNNAAGAATRWSPELSATLWSSYKVNDRLTVGGGVRYMGEQKRVVAPDAPVAPGAQGIASYTVADAVVSYQVSKNLALQLNVYNLSDEVYVATLNNGGSRASIGVERSAQLTANFTF